MFLPFYPSPGYGPAVSSGIVAHVAAAPEETAVAAVVPAVVAAGEPAVEPPVEPPVGPPVVIGDVPAVVIGDVCEAALEELPQAASTAAAPSAPKADRAPRRLNTLEPGCMSVGGRWVVVSLFMWAETTCAR